jgi:cysteinyl-tRNA synthetase
LGLFRAERKPAEISEEIRALIAERDEARKRKDWQKADQIRARLGRMGVILRDTPEGTEWLLEGRSSE